MKILALKRVARNDYATYGVFILNSQPLCMALELPWRDNQNDISCIPPGVYPCTLYNSPAHGEVYLLHEVPGRENVEIHPGNLDENTLGCILPGLYCDDIWSDKDKRLEYGVTSSKLAMNILKEKMGKDKFWLNVVYAL